MSQKKSKKYARQVRREFRKNYKTVVKNFVEEMRGESFFTRLRFAWFVLFPERVKKGHESNA